MTPDPIAGVSGEASSEPHVVCLHGLGRSPADWDGVAAGLGEIGEVRTPALPVAPVAATRAAADAIPAGAIVIGHSMGGVIALRPAHGRGLRYRALVLTDCFFSPARNGRTVAASVGDYLRHRVAYLRELRSVPPRAATGEAAIGPARTAASKPRSDQAAALGGLVRLALRRADFDAAAASVTAPVLVLHARDDHHVPVDFAIAAAARHPAWDLRLLPRGGHHVHVTEPEAWLAMVMPWLRARLATESEG